MTAKTALAAIALAALLATVAVAQEEADEPVVARPTRAPPHISDETIGILRQHQVGSLILPQGKPPFPAVLVMHGCNGVSPNTRVWARRLASWGYAALIIDSFSNRGLKQVCDGSRALPGPDAPRMPLPARPICAPVATSMPAGSPCWGIRMAAGRR